MIEARHLKEWLEDIDDDAEIIIASSHQYTHSGEDEYLPMAYTSTKEVQMGFRVQDKEKAGNAEVPRLIECSKSRKRKVYIIQ